MRRGWKNVCYNLLVQYRGLIQEGSDDLAVKTAETKLVNDYEQLRRREYELIEDLLEVLPKVDNLTDEQISQVRDAMFHADHPYLMVFVGPFSSGKSSIINALMGKADLLHSGVTPTTDRIAILRWGEEPDKATSGSGVESVFYPSPLLKKVSFVDTPGLESVFKEHEETTRRFLHRSDVVLLVMLATQAMTARNLDYLQTLKEYGKKVIIVINQVDLLSDDELETVHEYVRTESKARMGAEPEIWLVSARRGMAAHTETGLDAEQWAASGLNKIENYVDEQLSDVDRLRQKLRTPLQITQNVTQSALAIVRDNQSSLDHYKNISDNIDQQLAAQKREQEKIIRTVNEEISGKFGKAAMNGSEAIRDIFQISRSFSSVFRGVLELVGLGGLVRRTQGGKPYIIAAFEKHKAFAPLDELSTVSDRLAPRMEGKDIQDIDDLVKYAQREINSLPEAMQAKVIGTVQPPLQYDRSALESVRGELGRITEEARQLEPDKLDQASRNTLLYLAVYEILLLVIGFFLIQMGGENAAIILVVVLALALLGLVALPLRGRFMESAYTNRMMTLQAQYIEAQTKAADKQLAYGMEIRRDSILPLTRLVEAQTLIQTEQFSKLQSAEQEIASIESALTSMGKRNILGV